MIHVALVGCGGMGNWHAQTLKLIPEAKIVAFVDIVSQSAEAYRDKYVPDALVRHGFDALLEDPPEKLDAVVLCTPHTLHYGQAKASLQRGWHVLTDKPMVTASEHAYDLWKTVKETGKKLAVSFQAPYTAEYQYLRTLRDAGQWGKVQIISGWLAQGWLKGTVGKWRQDPALSGGGQMYDSGAHVLNAMMWLMNEPVVEVSCMYDQCGSPVDINGVAIMKFQSGAYGNFAIGGNSPGWNVRLMVQTDKLQFATGPHGGFVEMFGAPEFKYPHVPSSSEPAAFTPHRNFINALLDREELIVPVRYGVLLSALMDAVYESAAKKSPVTVKPVPAEIK